MTETSALSDFELPATGNQRFRLSAFRGHPCVIYFHPKNDTPGCTPGGSDFRDLHAELAKARSRSSACRATRSPRTRSPSRRWASPSS